MKILKNAVVGLSLLVFVGMCSAVGFAFEGRGKKHEQVPIKSLKEAAALLQKSHPAIAEDLTKFANAEEMKAAEMSKKHEAKIQLFRDSAAALQATRPDLAEGLNKYADHKAKWMEEKKEGKKEGKALEEKEKTDMTADFQAHVKLLRESAAALQATHPELAKKLDKYANHKAKEIARVEEKEETEE